VSTFITCGDGRRSIWWWRRRWRNQVEIKNNLVYKQKPITHKYIFMCYMKYTHVVLHNQYMKYVSCIDNRLNMYLNPMVHGSIPTKGKNFNRERVEKTVRWQCRNHLRWWDLDCYEKRRLWNQHPHSFAYGHDTGIYIVDFHVSKYYILLKNVNKCNHP
jgi:hypothetical protein